MKKNLLSILALSFGLSSFAQIVYTDITDQTLTPATSRETLAIDLDGDNTTDFVVYALDSSFVSQLGAVPIKGLAVDLAGNNMIDATQETNTAGDFLAVTVLSSGDAINSSSSFMASNPSNLLSGGGLGLNAQVPVAGSVNAGNFINTTDMYIGVKFEIGSAFHYGWIRVDVADNAATVTIKDFAYESTSGDAIFAGDTGSTGGVSINETELTNALVFFGNNELNINGISGSYSVAVVDLLGKSISNQTVTNNASINLGNVNNGIYLVQITKGNSVVTKKVYIK